MKEKQPICAFIRSRGFFFQGEQLKLSSSKAPESFQNDGVHYLHLRGEE